MTRIKSQIWSIALVLSLAVMGGIGVYAGSGAQQVQDTERTLDIERYPNEPLELVDLKIGEQSVKDKIKIGRRYRVGEGRDNVKFKEKDGWFKNVKIRLRNVSGKRITGVSAYLYFAPPATKSLYSMTLSGSTQLKRGLLEPNDEIEFKVSNQSWDQTANILRQYGIDANRASVSFSLGIVAFDDDTQWSKGFILRRDPDNPNRWIPADTKALSGDNRLNHPARFPTASKFEPGALQPQAGAQCKLDSGVLHCRLSYVRLL